MPGATLTTLSNLLKDYYLPPVVEQLNNEVLLLNRLESTDTGIHPGNVVVIPVHKGRSGGIGARPESGALPDPGAQDYARATYDLKFLYGRVRVTGPSMAKTSGEAQAFLQALRSELDGIRTDLKRDLARQAYGTGDSKLVTCGVTSASTTVVIASRENIDKGHIYPGMYIDIGTVANPQSVASNRKVTAVTPATPSVTIDGAAVTTAGTDFLFRAGSAGASVSYEISGLQQVVSTAANTFGNINAASAGNEYWDNLRDTSGGALALNSLYQNWNKVRRAGGETSAIITTLGLLRAYFNLLQSQVNYNEPMKIQGGWSTLEFMNKPLIADIDCPWGFIYFLDEKFLKIFSHRDWHFLDEDGNVLKWRTGYDEWEAVLARYLQLGAKRRNTQLVMSGLTDTTGV